MNELIVPARFNGPVRSGNGGFVAGSLAERVSTADVVEVTLRQPPPLETAMAVTSDAGVTTLAVGDEVVAIGTSSGGGRRRVTSTTSAVETRSAREPATKPPLPERTGPLKRAGTIRSFIS